MYEFEYFYKKLNGLSEPKPDMNLQKIEPNCKDLNQTESN